MSSDTAAMFCFNWLTQVFLMTLIKFQQHSDKGEREREKIKKGPDAALNTESSA